MKILEMLNVVSDFYAHCISSVYFWVTRKQLLLCLNEKITLYSWHKKRWVIISFCSKQLRFLHYLTSSFLCLQHSGSSLHWTSQSNGRLQWSRSTRTHCLQTNLWRAPCQHPCNLHETPWTLDSTQLCLLARPALHLPPRVSAEQWEGPLHPSSPPILPPPPPRLPTRGI